MAKAEAFGCDGPNCQATAMKIGIGWPEGWLHLTDNAPGHFQSFEFCSVPCLEGFVSGGSAAAGRSVSLRRAK